MMETLAGFRGADRASRALATAVEATETTGRIFNGALRIFSANLADGVRILPVLLLVLVFTSMTAGVGAIVPMTGTVAAARGAGTSISIVYGRVSSVNEVTRESFNGTSSSAACMLRCTSFSSSW